MLITGSTGHFGGAVIEFLLQKTDAGSIAALARNESKAEELKDKGIDVRIGDYDDYNSLVKALEGIEKLLFVSGSDVFNREQQHKNMVNAAKEAGVQHIIYTSFERKTESGDGPLGIVAKAHIETDRHIKDSGLTYTILRNNLYADGLPMFFGENVLENGIYLPAGDGKGAFAVRREMAEVAANVVAGEGHENKEYNVSNTRNYSMNDLASILSDISGREVKYNSPSVDEYKTTTNKAGVPDEAVKFTVMFCEAIKQGEFETSHSDMSTLLGRKPMSMKEFFQATYS